MFEFGGTTNQRSALPAELRPQACCISSIIDKSVICSIYITEKKTRKNTNKGNFYGNIHLKKKFFFNYF